MNIDQQASFCFNQAVTASAASTGAGTGANGYIDLAGGTGAFGSSFPTELFGIGEQVYVTALCTAAMTDSGSDSTVAVTIETADDSSFNTNKSTVMTLGTFAALSAAKTKFVAPLPTSATYRRYIRAYFTVANGNLTTGSFSVFITKDVQLSTTYPAGFSFPTGG